jgi:hypothetical protein
MLGCFGAMPHRARQSAGPNVGTTQSIVVDINAPNATNFPQLFMNDASLTNRTLDVGIPNGLVPGNLVLIMPGQVIVLDNRSLAQRDAS